MSLITKVSERLQIVYRLILNPKVVKYTIYSAILTFIPCIIIGYIVANLDATPFNFWQKTISSLGSRNETFIPKFLDDGAMLTSILLIPMGFSLHKHLITVKDVNKSEDRSKLRLLLAHLGLMFFLIGLVGFFGIGFYSVDVGNALGDIAYFGTRALNIHDIFSAVVFLGLGISGVFFGLSISVYKTFITNRRFALIVGIYLIFVPITIALCYVLITPIIYVLEWILLFSLFGGMIPLAITLVRKINREE
ncbi:MAG: hypothetical protein ACFFBP_06470 [Promethearchaeota archaeon]